MQEMNLQLKRKFINNIRSRTLLLLCLSTFLGSNSAFSQLSLVNSEVSLNDYSSTQSTGNCTIAISDSLNCQSIVVELSDALSDSVLFYQEYIFDQTTGLPAGTLWTRNGNEIVLGLGMLPKRTLWNAKIRLKDLQSNWTHWEIFSFN